MEVSEGGYSGWSFDWIGSVSLYYLSFCAVGIVGRHIAPVQFLKDARKLWKWQVIDPYYGPEPVFLPLLNISSG